MNRPQQAFLKNDSASFGQPGIKLALARGRWILAELENRRNNKDVGADERSSEPKERLPVAEETASTQTTQRRALASGEKALPTFYEFFAGGGMARAGLGDEWRCLFANEIDPKKAASYIKNWGGSELRVCDVAKLTSADLPEEADLAWASFPCQDLSLAGSGAGLKGERSGTFWLFRQLMTWLAEEGRAPRLIVLENVCGALTSHGGKDFVAIGTSLADVGYRFGAVVVDAVHFVPQSRPRLFVVAVRDDLPLAKNFARPIRDEMWHSGALLEAHSKLPIYAQDAWVWWKLPAPPLRNLALVDLIENRPCGVSWHSASETTRLLDMMSPLNRAKVEAAKKAGTRAVGGIYRRTRLEKGIKVQRAEVRFDDISGCLRTPAGGSSRQTIMIVEGQTVRSRLLSPREAARLMGLPEEYELPENYNEAYHLAGDGLVVPVVRFLSQYLLEPLLEAQEATRCYPRNLAAMAAELGENASEPALP